eukprot:SAG11_NODE_384_length_9897_cov_11.158502_10_plen_54_part_00
MHWPLMAKAEAVGGAKEPTAPAVMQRGTGGVKEAGVFSRNRWCKTCLRSFKHN